MQNYVFQVPNTTKRINITDATVDVLSDPLAPLCLSFLYGLVSISRSSCKLTWHLLDLSLSASSCRVLGPSLANRRIEEPRAFRWESPTTSAVLPPTEPRTQQPPAVTQCDLSLRGQPGEAAACPLRSSQPSQPLSVAPPGFEAEQLREARAGPAAVAPPPVAESCGPLSSSAQQGIREESGTPDSRSSPQARRPEISQSCPATAVPPPCFSLFPWVLREVPLPAHQQISVQTSRPHWAQLSGMPREMHSPAPLWRRHL
mmetsp:Transcript_26888/g.52804  ORF Transcript_26888/g.52804 Transcript_26888/m.52804 type:complete len:259 (+) Transcript_26888:176-952(+)